MKNLFAAPSSTAPIIFTVGKISAATLRIPVITAQIVATKSTMTWAVVSNVWFVPRLRMLSVLTFCAMYWEFYGLFPGQLFKNSSSRGSIALSRYICQLDEASALNSQRWRSRELVGSSYTVGRVIIQGQVQCEEVSVCRFCFGSALSALTQTAILA